MVPTFVAVIRTYCAKPFPEVLEHRMLTAIGAPLTTAACRGIVAHDPGEKFSAKSIAAPVSSRFPSTVRRHTAIPGTVATLPFNAFAEMTYDPAGTVKDPTVTALLP